ncbi:DUF7079 family protein [Rugamonas aquatica]
MALLNPMKDIANRSPVWAAMTEFFRDTALTDRDISHIAKICAASPYSVDELEWIMFTEVWPAFLPNLMAIAGEWAGWDEDFIRGRILDCYKPRFYLSWRLNPLKRYFCQQWPSVVQRVKHVRTAVPSCGR